MEILPILRHVILTLSARTAMIVVCVFHQVRVAIALFLISKHACRIFMFPICIYCLRESGIGCDWCVESQTCVPGICVPCTAYQNPDECRWLPDNTVT